MEEARVSGSGATVSFAGHESPRYSNDSASGTGTCWCPELWSHSCNVVGEQQVTDLESARLPSFWHGFAKTENFTRDPGCARGLTSGHACSVLCESRTSLAKWVWIETGVHVQIGTYTAAIWGNKSSDLFDLGRRDHL